MKKTKTTCLFIGLVLSFIIFACDKNETVLSSENESTNLKQNEATWINCNDNSKGFLISLKFFVGHTAEQCGGRCMKIFGQPVHIDCRGIGNICNHVVMVELTKDPNSGELSLALQNDEMFGEYIIFPFPDRCFYITNPQNNLELWLNIPEQVLLNDSSVTEIVIHDAWFSEEPELEND